jgi:hypothetical protein
VEELPNADLTKVPSFMPGENPFEHEFADRWHIPVDAALGGAETMYPEYTRKLKSAAK